MRQEAGRLVRWPTARQRAALRAKRLRARAKGQRPDRLAHALRWCDSVVANGYRNPLSR